MEYKATQDDINLYVANGGDLGILTDSQIKTIPQEIINQYAANGGVLENLTGSQIKAIPQEFINQRAANGGYLGYLTSSQIEAIPQEFINQRAANGENLYGLTSSQKEAVPQEIKKPTEKAKNALILYSAGKLNISDLPLDVFVNYKVRNYLLEIIKNIIKQEVNSLCEEYGYTSGVPAEITQEIDELMKSIYEEFESRKMEGIKQLEETAKIKE